MNIIANGYDIFAYTIYGQIIKLIIVIVGSLICYKNRDKHLIVNLVILFMGLFCFPGIFEYVFKKINIYGTLWGLLLSMGIPALYVGFIVKKYNWLSGIVSNAYYMILFLVGLILKRRYPYAQLSILIIFPASIGISALFGFLGGFLKQILTQRSER